MPAKSGTRLLKEEIAVSYYKWEFLRRSSDYRQDYEAFDKRFGPWLRRHGRHPNMKDPSDEVVKHYYEKIYPEEVSLRIKWGVYSPVDPNFHAELAVLQQNPLLRFRMPFAPEQRLYVRQRVTIGESPETLDLSISLAGSKREILEQVEFLIDLALRKRKQAGRIPRTPRKRLQQYGEYLQVWDLRQEGRTFRQIAEISYSDQVRRWDTLPKKEKKNPANPIVQRVRDHYREACRLIDGGSKEIR